jgi:uncharacterized protein YvpB
MQLTVPFLSQHSDVADPKWQKESCTIVNLAMALSYYGKKVTTEELIAEGESIGGYCGEKIGWDHESIVRLARNHGINAYRQEFRSNNKTHQKELTEKGIEKLAQHIQKGNVATVSVRNKFEASRGFHTILLIGVSRNLRGRITGFIYHDPDNEVTEGKNQIVDKQTFLIHWRKLAIFFEE